jgi:low affinity Fe/Cu permease
VSSQKERPTMPSDVTPEVSWFDRMATWTDRFVSRAWFFALSVALVVGWAPSYFLFRDVDTWQLWINTATTILTYLLVALLQNTQRRADDAVQHKLNAIADGLAHLLESRDGDQSDARELRAAVGLEDRESA